MRRELYCVDSRIDNLHSMQIQYFEQAYGVSKTFNQKYLFENIQLYSHQPNVHMYKSSFLREKTPTQSVVLFFFYFIFNETVFQLFLTFLPPLVLCNCQAYSSIRTQLSFKSKARKFVIAYHIRPLLINCTKLEISSQYEHNFHRLIGTHM